MCRPPCRWSPTTGYQVCPPLEVRLLLCISPQFAMPVSVDGRCCSPFQPQQVHFDSHIPGGLIPVVLISPTSLGLSACSFVLHTLLPFLLSPVCLGVPSSALGPTCVPCIPFPSSVHDSWRIASLPLLSFLGFSCRCLLFHRSIFLCRNFCDCLTKFGNTSTFGELGGLVFPILPTYQLWI